jgi:parvulin-like peptidyl-prolyl isomerase
VLEAAGDAPRRRFERLPLLPREGALEEPYAEALFATPIGELHPAVVRTRYGFHVILVTEEVPEEVTPFEEAAPEIREALVLEGRAELLSRILREAANERGVEMEESAIAQIAALELDT